MNINSEKLKPGVDKCVLLLLAGFVWIGVGIMLLTFAHHWLAAYRDHFPFVVVGIGAALALAIHHLGFLRIVDKNLGRILPMTGKRCAFSFMTWKSYITVAVMATGGALLRRSPIPKSYLSTVYIGIGFALVLSSVRYLRVLVRELRKRE